MKGLAAMGTETKSVAWAMRSVTRSRSFRSPFACIRAIAGARGMLPAASSRMTIYSAPFWTTL